jgi:DNA-binding NtrC family response regulator
MTRRALVVDDDRTMVKTLTDVLSLKGWEVTGAYSGKDAVEKANAGSFDLVLMDVKMPEMDGVEAFKAMQQRNPSVRVVLMTAYAEQDRLDEAVRKGVLRILSKPVNFAELLPLLAEARGRGTPILLVDDDAQFLQTLAETLKLRGYETVMARTLDETQRLLAAQSPRAVLLHMHLGAEAARDAVESVRRIRPGTALILYSGRDDGARELNETLPAEAVHAYFQKPFAVDDVAGALDAIGE